MTIVVAMQFADRICVLSDTMISNSEGVKNNVLPGRLKSIVINDWLTISYAGLSTQAIDAIRSLNNQFHITTELTIEYLSEASRKFNDDLDFIVCSHEHNARLIKITNGQVFEGASAYWIGSSKAAALLSNIDLPSQECANLPDYISQDEMIFKHHFHEFMRTNRCEGIGGAIIDCLCSPYGHCYNIHASSSAWDTLTLNDNPVQREHIKQTGIYHYEYNVYAPTTRGQALVGLYLGQIAVGFIYDPIHYDEAMVVKDIGHSDFSHLVENSGKVLAKKPKSFQKDNFI